MINYFFSFKNHLSESENHICINSNANKCKNCTEILFLIILSSYFFNSFNELNECRTLNE
jgi:hypothetical protein